MDHEIIEQVLYDLTGSTRRDQLRRITMTYALGSGEGEWMKMDGKVNAALREALARNHAVGLLAGTYDEALTITRVSDYLLHILDYSLEEFREISGVSLGTLFGKELPLFSDRERFSSFQGRAEAVLMMKGGLPLKTYLYKMDTVREDGERIWILSVQVNWSDENLEVVTHTLRAGFWYTDYDEEGKYKGIVYNQAFRQMLGFQDESDFPNTWEAWADLVHPSDAPRVFRNVENVAWGRMPRFEMDYRVKDASGVYHWFRDNAEAIRRQDGTPRRMVGVFFNIDKEKRLEQKQRRSDAFHRALTTANLSEYYVELKEGTFSSLKEDDSLFAPWETGSSWKELVKVYIERFVCEEDRRAMALLYSSEYLLRQIRLGNREFSLDCRIRIGEDIRWVRNTLIYDEGDDGSTGLLVFVRDITEVKAEAERIEELIHKKDEIDLLLQGTLKLIDCYAVCDLAEDTYDFYSMKSEAHYPSKGTYHDFVRAAGENNCTLEGSDSSFEDMIAPAYLWERLLHPESVFRFEYREKNAERYKTMSVSPLQWEHGRAKKILLISQNTTQEKLSEIRTREALRDACQTANRANQAKTEFLSNMSHDIRTPMNAIVGMTAIAGAHIHDKERVRDCLEKITQASHHLLGLINEVLAMARIENGKISLNEEDFNLSDLVGNIVTISRVGIEKHGHRLDMHISKITHENVRGDSLRLQQLLMNVMSNAIKYTPDGGRIGFSIREIPTEARGGGCYEFIIKDNGIGMTRSFQRIMFEPFSRADEKRTSQIQGTGLGMAIAQNIARLMNGTISVESAPGKGSTFTITLYLKWQEEKIDDLGYLIHRPILIVDDDVLSGESAVGILNDIGLQGVAATSGEEAIAKAEALRAAHENYHAVIIDWKMPGMGGIETVRRLRKIVGAGVTIIILSAYDYAAIETEAREAGADDFITKPLFRPRLLTALKASAEGESKAVEETDVLELSGLHLDGRRILVVEDNALNREIAQELLEMTGADVETAMNGQDGVDKVASHPSGYYQLVFMDIQMPVMNGYEATRAIRRLPGRDAKALPILAMTANAFVEDVIRAQNAGMNEHIAKPLDMAGLSGVLRRWVK